jgi:signal transduction histidine kinase
MHYILKAERAGEGFAIACSAIVQKHRGAIEFESGAGRGTAFRIRLPLQGTDGA